MNAKIVHSDSWQPPLFKYLPTDHSWSCSPHHLTLISSVMDMRVKSQNITFHLHKKQLWYSCSSVNNPVFPCSMLHWHNPVFALFWEGTFCDSHISIWTIFDLTFYCITPQILCSWKSIIKWHIFLFISWLFNDTVSDDIIHIASMIGW
jgi:hypothetical protein